MRISVPLAHAYRLLNHGPYPDQQRPPISAISWPPPRYAGGFQPPKVAVVIDKSSHPPAD